MSTPILFSIIVYGSLTMGTVSCDVIFKKFDHFSAMLTFDIENGTGSPFLCVISCTFSHIFNPL